MAVALTKERQDTADAALTALADALRVRQPAVRSSAGRYRQLPRGRSWGTWEDQKPAAVTAWVDEYLAPNGPGYVVCVEVADGDGATYRREVHGAGPEAWRERAWTPVLAGG